LEGETHSISDTSTEQFDGSSRDTYRLSDEQVAEIMATLDPQVIADIEFVQAQVRRFAQAQRDSLVDIEVETLPGVLLGQTNKDDAASYVSGLLVGTDVRIGLTWPMAVRIMVIGRPELTRLYAAAIVEAGREAVELDGEQCFLAGIQEIAKRIS